MVSLMSFISWSGERGERAALERGQENELGGKEAGGGTNLDCSETQLGDEVLL